MAQLSTKLPWELAQTKWASTINPIIALPILNGNLISGVNLLANVAQAINHQLGRLPQGWILTDNTAAALIWRPVAWNQFSITLESDADTTISFWVF